MRTPSDQETPLGEYLELRDSLRANRIGRGGGEICQALTHGLDTAVRSLISPYDLDERVALVAIGGYGREELSPYSDVDLMVLHALEDPSSLAAAVFRPLWDAKLKVGHAVRTVKEAAGAAKEKFETHTTLLTSRLVAGSTELFSQLTAEIARVTKARPLRRYLVVEERQRRLETPYLLMAADVKSGRGGLRTLQGFEWERRREELIGRFSTESRHVQEQARERLLQIRNGLHVSVGRAHDVYALDLRAPVARWLGMSVYDASEMLVDTMQAVDRLAAQRWPEVTHRREGHVGRRVLTRLVGSDDSAQPVKPLTVDGLVGILRSGDQGRAVFERLWDQGRLTDELSEWQTVKGLPQLAPFHQHPVGEHLWRTVEEMRNLIAGNGEFGSIVATVESEATLLLSAFLHDIGKGRGGDHASIGADIARSVCERLGCAVEVSALVEGAVRHHLLLAQTASRRDIDDPAVVDEIASTLGSLRLLRVVYLLTVADSRATGSTIWNEWKAKLIGTLYHRCAGRLGAGDAKAADTGTTIERVLAETPADQRGSVEAHLKGMPEEYLRSTSTADALWHVQLIGAMDGGPNLGVRSGSPVDTAVVVGRSRPGFRRVVAEVFAANGIDVLEARLSSRSDGLVVDSFQVKDDRTGGPVREERWESARDDIRAALAGELDTEAKVATRAAAYASQVGTEVKPQVNCSLDPASDELVITVKCSDRIGRLAEILAILQACHLEIRLAKLDSRAGEVVDTFHISTGGPGDDPTALVDLEHRIAMRIDP